MQFEFGPAICYSGFRAGQSPAAKHPTELQVMEDLLLISKYWKYIRLYDVGRHAQTVLEVIRREKIDLKVMIGTCLSAEQNNEACPWQSTNYTQNQLRANKRLNRKQIWQLIGLADQYADFVFAVSAGNEATVDWTDHLVPVESVIEYVRMIKKGTDKPVTFCENYVPWQDKLHALAEEVDFISLHTYPIWEYKKVDEALIYTIENYEGVKLKYPDKTVVITEAGWATRSNGRGIPQENANEDFQKIYYENLSRWCSQKGVLTFFFEAFDEDWKGSDEPLEPEKHWGIFTNDRKPKKVMTKYFI
jgi:exo-beta-1,3-glucanase (GH17 family)